MNQESLDTGLEISKYHDFVIFTSTFYKDDVEGKVRSEACFEMLDNARALGLRVVVGDGGSGSDFLKRVSEYPNVTLIHSGRGGKNTDLTMAGERRFTGKIAMEKYSDVSFFLWMEPEKANLVKSENIDAILQPLRDGSADMVVPSRKSKSTLPPQQRSAENRANRRANSIITESKMTKVMAFKDRYTEYIIEPQDIFKIPRIYSDNSQDNFQNNNAPYDLWFGPKAFTRKSMEEDFLTYTGSKWDGIITSVLAGKQRGKTVIDVPVNFTYPPKQTELETDPDQVMKYQRFRRSQYRYIIKTIKKLVSQI